jgi:hypothetical protein
MYQPGRLRTLTHMKRRLFFILLVTGLILLALGGWAIKGLRWAAGGRPTTVPQPA